MSSSSLQQCGKHGSAQWRSNWANMIKTRGARRRKCQPSFFCFCFTQQWDIVMKSVILLYYLNYIHSCNRTRFTKWFPECYEERNEKLNVAIRDTQSAYYTTYSVLRSTAPSHRNTERRQISKNFSRFSVALLVFPQALTHIAASLPMSVYSPSKRWFFQSECVGGYKISFIIVWGFEYKVLRNRWIKAISSTTVV